MTTRSELLDVVHRFYPRGVLPYARIHVPPGEPSYDDTEEHLRLVEAASRGRAEDPTWKTMTRRVGDRYDLQNESIRLLRGGSTQATRPASIAPRTWSPSPRSAAGLRLRLDSRER